MSYSTDNDLVLIFHNIATTPGYAPGESDFAKERAKATEWVDDSLRDRYTVPFSATFPEMVILAEANYAVYMILKAHSENSGFEFSLYQPFLQEAKSLINRLRAFKTGPDGSTELDIIQSTKTNVEPVIAKSKIDRDGNRLNPGLAPRKLDYF